VAGKEEVDSQISMREGCRRRSRRRRLVKLVIWEGGAKACGS
jgi:hypothetical protein